MITEHDKMKAALLWIALRAGMEGGPFGDKIAAVAEEGLTEAEIAEVARLREDSKLLADLLGPDWEIPRDGRGTHGKPKIRVVYYAFEDGTPCNDAVIRSREALVELMKDARPVKTLAPYIPRKP